MTGDGIVQPSTCGYLTTRSARSALLSNRSWSRAVYHLYVVRVDDREALMSFLKDQGIGTGIHYPIPLHLQNAYRDLGYVPGDFPVTEKVAAEIVSLPMYPQLHAHQQRYVVEMILKFCHARAPELAGTR